MFTEVRSFRAAATFTLVLSHPNNAPGIAFVVSKCCVAMRPIDRCPMRRQHYTVASILFVRVVPLAVVSTCVPRERPSWMTGMHCLTCNE